jgi:hypothetical protein
VTIETPRYQADQLPDLRTELVRLYDRHAHDHTMVAILLVAMGLLDLCDNLAAQLDEVTAERDRLAGTVADYSV